MPSWAETCSAGGVLSGPTSAAVSKVVFNLYSPCSFCTTVMLVELSAVQRPQATGHASATDVPLLPGPPGSAATRNATV